MSNLDYAAKQLNKIRNRISAAAESAGRAASDVQLVGASKMQSADRIRSFAQQGLAAVGENYLQEAIEKKGLLHGLNVQWHFIGHIQSNKTKLIAQHFDWVHGVDRFKIAKRLSDQNPHGSALNILLQINLDQEASKSGVTPNAAASLCDQIAQLEQVRLRGFMVIPKPSTDPNVQRSGFAQACNLLQSTNQQYGLHMDTLSMGMSNDLEAAIAEGSNMVRIGSDLFGARPES